MEEEDNNVEYKNIKPAENYIFLYLNNYISIFIYYTSPMPYGNFYVGQEGFLYKKNNGGGARRNFSLGAICNQPTDIYNKYVSGSGVSGAVSSTNYAIRRKMIRNASKCSQNNCSLNYYYLGYPLGGRYYTSTPTPTPCIPVAIDIGSIATNDGEGTYTLNGNYTITECQILNIAVDTTLLITGGKTLTNNGTINNNSQINNYSSTIQNNGTINNSGIIFNYGGTINNNTGGTINNNTGSYIYNQTSGIFNNSSTFNNSGYHYNTGGGGCTINNNAGGFIYTYGSGAIFNNIGGAINNNAGGFIYTYGGGNIYNDSGATINNNTGGTISTADGSSTCGTGTISGLGTFTGVVPTNTNCPP
jgi:hypothetical protein